MKENSIEKTLENIQNVDLITLLRKFKKEGVKNFIVIRRNDYDEILSDYKRVLKINEVLLKENEEIRIKNNAIKRESEAYAEYMIRLDNELNLEKEKSKYEWIRQNCLSQELVNKLYIPVQKVKAKIEELNDVSNAEELEDTMDGKNYTITELVQYVLQELLESEE